VTLYVTKANDGAPMLVRSQLGPRCSACLDIGKIRCAFTTAKVRCKSQLCAAHATEFKGRRYCAACLTKAIGASNG
jgi:hypothetical protein